MSINSTTSRKSLSLNTGSEILNLHHLLVIGFWNSITAAVVAALTVSIVLEMS